MAKYYVNKNAQRNGDHEVHKDGCASMPDSENKQCLGEFYDCHGAVIEAEKHYARSNGCEHCCRACHTS